MPAIEPPKPPPLTPEERATFLAEVQAGVGTREALRRSGVNGGSTALQVTHAYAKALLAEDDELRRDYEIARGRDIDKVEGVVFAIATDTNNPKALDAAKFLLERLDPRYGQASRVEVTGAGGKPIEIEDRSASLADVARVLEAAGALAQIGSGTARAEVPSPRALLPQSSDS